MRLHRIRVLAPALAAAGMLLLAQAPSAAAQDAGDDPVVATVNGTELHVSDVIASARDLPRAYQEQIGQYFPALVERLIDLELLAEEGRRQGLQNDAEVKAQVADFESQAVRAALLDRYVRAGLTDDAVRAKYDEFVAQFQPEREIRARHILVATEDEAKAIIAELDAGGDFAAIAKEKSTDTGSGAQGGDLGFFTAEQMVPEFSAAAFALAPGAYTAAPVKSQFGWHIIKVEEARETAPPSFEQARPQIEDALSRDLVTKLRLSLRETAEIVLPEPPAAAAPAPAAAGAEVPPAAASEEAAPAPE